VTSKGAMSGADEAIREIGGRVFPCKQRGLDGVLVFKTQFGRSEKPRKRGEDFSFCQAIAASQHPFSFQQHQKTDEYAAACTRLAADDFLGALELRLIVLHEKAHQNIGETEHLTRQLRNRNAFLRPMRRQSWRAWVGVRSR